MFTSVAETRSGGACIAAPIRAGAGLQIVKRLMILFAMALGCGVTSAARAEHPTTYVYVLLGGLVGVDGYVDSDGLLLLAGRIATIPYTWVETYPWGDWVKAANRIWAR